MKKLDKARVEQVRARLQTPRGKKIKQMVVNSHNEDLAFALCTIGAIIFADQYIESTLISILTLIPLLGCGISIGIGLYLVNKRGDVFAKLYKDNATFEEVDEALPIMHKMLSLHNLQSLFYYGSLIIYVCLFFYNLINNQWVSLPTNS